MSDIHALVGAYAVDALDDIERAAFERHLADCAACRAEVAGLREAASQLAETAAQEPPAELRDRVLAGISTVRPLPPVVEPAAPRSRGRRFRPALLVAAAAVIAAVGVGGAIAVHPWSDDSSQVTPSAVDAVLEAPDARASKLDFDNGASATVVHSDSVGAAVLETHRMPPPPSGKVYQLWLDQPGLGMVPAGLMKVTPDQTLLLDGDAATATAAGITVEPAGGSTTPSGEPIAVFDFGKKA